MKKTITKTISVLIFISLLLISCVSAVQLEQNSLDEKYLGGSSYGLEINYHNKFKPSTLKYIEFPLALNGTALLKIVSNNTIIYKEIIEGSNYEQFNYIKDIDLNIPIGEYKLSLTSNNNIKWAIGRNTGDFYAIGKNSEKIQPKIGKTKYSFEHKLIYEVEDNDAPVTTLISKIKNNKAKIYLSCTDIGSGCKTTYVKIGDSDYNEINKLYLKHSALIYFHSIDMFGNIEATQTLNIELKDCYEEIIEGDWSDWYIVNTELEKRNKLIEIFHEDDECDANRNYYEYEERERICEEEIIKGKWILTINCTNGTYTETAYDVYLNADDICDNNYNITETREKNC